MSELLVGSPKSCLYKSLIENHNLYHFLSCTGYSTDELFTKFSIGKAILIPGLTGVVAEAKDNIETIMKETLEAVCQTGFEKDYIQSILNQVEIFLKVENAKFKTEQQR